MKRLQIIDVNHVKERLARIVPTLRTRILNVMTTLEKRTFFPNERWYRTVTDTDGTTVIGHICGFGTNISTIYSPDMQPKGIRI